VRARLWQSPADTTTTLAREGLDLLWQQLALLVAVAQLAKTSIAPAPDGAVGGEGEAVTASSRHSNDTVPPQGLDLLRQQLVLHVAVEPACPSIAPAPDAAVGGDGDAVEYSSRHSDDALVSQGLNLLGQQLALLVAVAQAALPSTAPAPDAAVSGDGEAVTISSRDSDDALASKGLELLGQQLVLLVAVATAPAPDGAVGGGGEAVAASNRRGCSASE